MKIVRVLLIPVSLMLCSPLLAQIKPCEQLKSEIETKLKDRGVTRFSLEVVPADQVRDQKVVGSCDGGKNKIIYTKESPAPKNPEKK
jgi:hypothetical protein